MRVGIHQPHYLPWLRYFEKIAQCDVFILLDDTQYEKNGWQNRNKVKNRSGEAVLTVPVHAPLGARICDVGVDNAQRWQQKHWRTIEQSYAKAPHYTNCAEALRPFYEMRWDKLAPLNRSMLSVLLVLLGVHTPVVASSELGVLGEATERLVGLVQAVGGTRYYTGAYALAAYLEPQLFDQAGIALDMQDWLCPQYSQLHGQFLPDLSIVDLLMNCGAHSRRLLLGETA
jgi:hypothetical protein